MLNNSGDMSEAKRKLRARGVTLREFAVRHGFKYRDVSDVVRGIRKGYYGTGREISEAIARAVDENGG